MPPTTRTPAVPDPEHTYNEPIKIFSAGQTEISVRIRWTSSVSVCALLSGGAANDDDRLPPTPAAPAVALSIPPANDNIDACASARIHFERKPKPSLGALSPAFFTVVLPALNLATIKGDVTVGGFADVIRAGLSEADLAALAEDPDRYAEVEQSFVLARLGILATSVTRHFRAREGGSADDEALFLIPGLEAAMLKFGNATGCPPRDTAYSIWASDDPLVYIHAQDGDRFGDSVRASEKHHGRAADALLPIRTGEVDFAEPEALALLESATAEVGAFYENMAALGKPAFPKDFLMMREFLQKLLVGGVAYEAPNATYTRAWSDFDVGLGLLEDHGFREIVAKRAFYMPPRERRRIDASLQMPSIADIVLEFFAGTGEMTSKEIIHARMHEMAPTLRANVHAAGVLAAQSARLLGTHFGVIKKNLTEPVEQMTPDDRAKLGVNPEKGVSGKGIQHTHDLMRARQAHPLRFAAMYQEEKKND